MVVLFLDLCKQQAVVCEVGLITLAVMDGEESICDNNVNNELVGGGQTIAIINDVLEQSKLVVGRLTISLNVTTLIDPTTKHVLTTNNGYNMAVVGLCNMYNVSV